MGVNPTLPNFNSLTFDGFDSRDYGVYISGEAVFNAPEKAVEMVSIPGRNGAYALDKGHFENIEVRYPAGIFANGKTDFATAISDFRNVLCSRVGYCRLADSYNPDEYRLAVYKSGLEVTPEQLIAGEFDIVFDCKPQRYLTSGEEFIEIGEWGDVETAEGAVVSVDVDSEDTKVKSLTAEINAVQDLHGYDSPWVGGGGKNKLNNDKSLWSKSGTSSTGYSADALRLAPTGFTIPFEVGATYTISLTDNTGTGRSFYVGVNQYANGSRIADSGWVSMPYTFTINGSTDTLRLTFRTTDNVDMSAYLAAVGTTFLIQLEKGSSATTWTPYENICPISGWASVDATVCGANIFDGTWQNGYWDVDTGQFVSSVNWRATQKFKALVGDKYEVSKDNAEFTATGRLLFFYADGSCADGGYTRSHFTIPTNCVAFALYTGTLSVGGDFAIKKYTTTPNYTYVAYSGTDYTTSLGTTVYGGTVDLASGVLTVDRVSETLDGTEAWGATANCSQIYLTLSDMKIGTNVGGLADWLPTVTNTLNVGAMFGYNNRVLYLHHIPDIIPGITSIEAFKTYLSNNPLQVVYPLETPTTVTLTPQQIDLLLGENNIWADSGNVKIEYGLDPNILVNPTLFESRPLLYAEGYGNINLGSNAVTVNNEVIGNVLLANKIYRDNGNDSVLDPAAVALLEVGDTITVSSGSNLIIAIQGRSGGVQVTSVSATVTGGNAQLIEGPTTSIVQQVDGRISMIFDEMEFINGTSSSCYVDMDVSITYKENGVTSTWTSSLTGVGYRYVSSGQPYVYFNGFQETPAPPDTLLIGVPKQSTIEQINGYSTKLVVSDGYYLDLDVGEAYVLSDGIPSSINNIVQIPAELPTLKPGKTTISHSNTITTVKVQPRWWKV